jgi:hypothetical protein
MFTLSPNPVQIEMRPERAMGRYCIHGVRFLAGLLGDGPVFTLCGGHERFDCSRVPQSIKAKFGEFASGILFRIAHI